MTEQGKVVKTEGEYATVSVDKKEECSKCGMCAFPKNAKTVEFYAKNGLGAKAGDTVIIERKADGRLSGVILAFLVPLVLIGVAMLLNYLFMNKEIWILILSAIFIAVWYTVLALIDKKLAFTDKFISVIVQIKESNNTGEETKEQNPIL